MITRWRVIGVMVLLGVITGLGVITVRALDRSLKSTDGIDVHSSVTFKEELLSEGEWVDPSPRPLKRVTVFKDGGKRFALTQSSTEGSYLVDITDVDNPSLIPQPATNLMLPASHFSSVRWAKPTDGEIDTWVANDGKRYFAAVSSYKTSSDSFIGGFIGGFLQVFGTDPRGGLWDKWTDGSFTYVADGDRIGNTAHDVFVYTLQDGMCETSTGCEVFPSIGSAPAVSVNQGEPIYKNYAVVSGSSGLNIYDVTNPKALCNCSSGAGQTALLKSTVLQPSNGYSSGLVYYQQGDKHYALYYLSDRDDRNIHDHDIQILDISDPNTPDTIESLSEPDPDQVRDRYLVTVDVYTVGDRYYAVSIYKNNLAMFRAENRIQITDITDPTNIVTVSYLNDSEAPPSTYGYPTLGYPRDVSMLAVGDLRYAVVTYTKGVEIVDVTNPAAPAAKWSIASVRDFIPEDVDTFQDGDRYYAIIANGSFRLNALALQILELTEVASDAGNDAGSDAKIT